MLIGPPAGGSIVAAVASLDSSETGAGGGIEGGASDSAGGGASSGSGPGAVSGSGSTVHGEPCDCSGAGGSGGGGDCSSCALGGANDWG